MARCPWKGRRGPEARSRLAAFTDELEALRRKVAQGKSAPELLAITQASRQLEGQLKLKFAWLSELPWRLWEIKDHVSAAEAVAEYDAQELRDPGRLHRVSRRLFSLESPLGRDMRAYARGDSLTEDLRRELWGYKLARIDESPVEGIHRDVRDVVQKSRAPPSWWASTLRLRENLAAWEACSSEADRVYFLRAFRNWTCAVQPRPREARLLRPCRMKPGDCRDFMYRLRLVSLMDWGPVGAFVSMALPAPPAARLSALRAMQCDWMRGVFKTGCWIAVGDQVDQVHVWLILDDAPASKKTLGPKAGVGMAVAALMQCFDPLVLESWPVTEPFEVLPAQDPRVCDLLHLLPFATIRRTARVCSVAAFAEHPGCTRLQIGGLLSDKQWDVDCPDTPALVLLDMLRQTGWGIGRKALFLSSNLGSHGRHCSSTPVPAEVSVKGVGPGVGSFVHEPLANGVDKRLAKVSAKVFAEVSATMSAKASAKMSTKVSAKVSATVSARVPTKSRTKVSANVSARVLETLLATLQGTLQTCHQRCRQTCRPKLRRRCRQLRWQTLRQS